MAASNPDVVDPCGEFGPTQRAALVWMIGSIAFGIFLTAFLAAYDGYLYESKGRWLDYQKYSENRKALSSIPSEGSDPRALATSRVAAERAIAAQAH